MNDPCYECGADCLDPSEIFECQNCEDVAFCSQSCLDSHAENHEPMTPAEIQRERYYQELD